MLTLSLMLCASSDLALGGRVIVRNGDGKPEHKLVFINK